MDLRSMLIVAVVLVAGISLLMTGVGWVIRQQAMLTLDELQDTLTGDVQRLLATLGRCLDPAQVRVSRRNAMVSFPVRSCTMVARVVPRVRRVVLRFASQEEAALLFPLRVLARKSQGQLVIEKDGCRMRVGLPEGTRVQAVPIGGTCPPDSGGRFLVYPVRQNRSIWVELRHTPGQGLRLALTLPGNPEPLFVYYFSGVKAMDVTFIVGGKRFLAYDATTQDLRYDLDSNDDRRLTLADRPVVRPFLLGAAEGMVFHLLTEAPFAHRTGVLCGRNQIRPGERRACLELEIPVY